jgi:hypothetical protein
MARRTRCSDSGYVYHVLNRAVGRAKIFEKPADYAAFEKVLRQAWERRRKGVRLGFSNTHTAPKMQAPSSATLASSRQ